MPKRAMRESRSPAKDQKPSSYMIRRHKRFWAVLDAADELVCLTVYKRGAAEVVRRLHTFSTGSHTHAVRIAERVTA